MFVEGHCVLASRRFVSASDYFLHPKRDSFLSYLSSVFDCKRHNHWGG